MRAAVLQTARSGQPPAPMTTSSAHTDPTGSSPRSRAAPASHARTSPSFGKIIEVPTPAHVLSHLGDVARGTELHRFGLSRRMLSAAVREGAILRVRNGVFALPSTCSDTVGAAAHGGALTCSRALRMHGVWTLDDDEHPHVWMGTHGRTHHSGCACTSHYFDGPTALGLAPLEDALVHVLLCRGDEAFFVALESALRLRKLRAAGRARIRARLPRRARWLVDFARSDADSGLESLLRLRLHLLGILWNARWTSPPSAGSTSWSIGC